MFSLSKYRLVAFHIIVLRYFVIAYFNVLDASINRMTYEFELRSKSSNTYGNARISHHVNAKIIQEPSYKPLPSIFGSHLLKKIQFI